MKSSKSTCCEKCHDNLFKYPDFPCACPCHFQKTTWEKEFDALTSKWDGQDRASAKAFFRATLHTIKEKIRGMKKPIDNRPEKVGYIGLDFIMGVGETVSCGHCDPQYKKIEDLVPDAVCSCRCHKKPIDEELK